MKRNGIIQGYLPIFLMVIFILVSNALTAQTDTTKPVTTDTTKPVTADTTKAATSAAAKKEGKQKRKDEFIIYGGANYNQADVSATNFKSEGAIGYHLGVSYKRGSFFYWQVGARYNNANFNFVSKTTSSDTSKLAVRALDVPLTAGINFLSFANRVIALRAFVSLVPSFTLGVGDNNLNVTKSDINSFIFYGQAGVGVDIAFVTVDLGYNYGFQDLYKNYSGSNPGQAFLSLGFRF